MDATVHAAWIDAVLTENLRSHDQIRKCLSALVAAVSGDGAHDVCHHLEELRKSVERHYQSETQFMKAIPHYDPSSHIDAHEHHIFFMADTIKILPELSGDELRRRATVLDMWFTEHVRTMDADLLEALPKKR